MGASEFFRTESSLPAQFDKILLMTSMQYLEEPRVTFQHALMTLKQTGKMLIVHRAAPTCTLPLFTEARERMHTHDQSYLSIIKDLQVLGCDVHWEVECVTIRMRKLEWLSLVFDRFPSEFQAISHFEILAGLRELSEGVMKYASDTDVIEFPDRLIFITAEIPVLDPQYPRIGRKSLSTTRHSGETGSREVKYELKVSDDIETLLRLKEEEKREREALKRKNLTATGGILP